MNMPVVVEESPRVGVPENVEIDSANVRVYYLSRNWACLSLVVVALLAAGVFLGQFLSNPHPAGSARDAGAVLQGLLRERRPELAPVMECLLHMPVIPPSIDAEIARSTFAPGARGVASALAGSLREGFNEPNSQLIILAHQSPPEAGANTAMAELYARQGDTAKAREYYQRELEIYPSAAVRAKLLALVASTGEIEPIAKLASDPLYSSMIPPSLRMQLALSAGDWMGAAKRFLQSQAATLRPQPLIMALAAALAWLIIALHAGQPHDWFSFRMLAPLVATLLGVAGGVVAQFLSVAQKDLWGLTATGGFLGDLGVYAGVNAPRDMLIQLLLMLPFIPILVRRRSALDTLVVTGCVGLGFAFPGTLELCEQLAPADSLGRLLTANFFHFAAAALVGQAVCRCLRRERGSITAALTTIPSVVLTLGVYDAFTRIPGAHVLVVLASIAFLILCRVFFLELRKWRDSFTDQCFLGATLAIGLGALIATVLVAASSEHGFEAAAGALVRNLPTLLMVSVVFFSQFKRGFAAIGSDLTAPSHS
jgi:protease PrsW